MLTPLPYSLWEIIKTEQNPDATVYKKLSAGLPQSLHYLQIFKGKVILYVEFDISYLACYV